MKKKMSELPYVILLGDVGAGKSTIVEKLTGATGRSSSASQSVTVISEVFEVYDHSLIICDTPGSNSMDNYFRCNLHIAHAMNFKPVSLVLIVVKADARMDNVIDNVEQYALGFLPEDFPIDLVGVCITHMDYVSWAPSDLLSRLSSHLGIDSAMFVSQDSTRETIMESLRSQCAQREPVHMSIDGEIFFKLFQIDSVNIKVLTDCRREVGRYEKMKADFEQKKQELTEREQMYLVFEFLTFMLDQIGVSQKKLSEDNNFEFNEGPGMASEAGHVANLSNQLNKVINDLRGEAAQYHRNLRTDLGRCPYCPAVWRVNSWYSGAVICGVKANDGQILPNHDGIKLCTFQFTWDWDQRKLIIDKHNRDEVLDSIHNQTFDESGCGNTIELFQMVPLNESEVHVSAVKEFHSKKAASKSSESWYELLYRKLMRKKSDAKPTKDTHCTQHPLPKTVDAKEFTPENMLQRQKYQKVSGVKVNVADMPTCESGSKSEIAKYQACNEATRNKSRIPIKTNTDKKFPDSDISKKSGRHTAHEKYREAVMSKHENEEKGGVKLPAQSYQSKSVGAESRKTMTNTTTGNRVNRFSGQPGEKLSDVRLKTHNLSPIPHSSGKKSKKHFGAKGKQIKDARSPSFMTPSPAFPYTGGAARKTQVNTQMRAAPNGNGRRVVEVHYQRNRSPINATPRNLKIGAKPKPAVEVENSWKGSYDSSLTKLPQLTITPVDKSEGNSAPNLDYTEI